MMADTRINNERFDRAMRAVCSESCAYRGEPSCWNIDPEQWPNPNCDEPGCEWLARVAIEAWEANNEV